MSQQEPITRREFMQIGSAAALALGVPLDARGLRESDRMRRGKEELSPQAIIRWDLGQLKWQVSGFVPYLWGVDHYTDIRQAPDAEIGPIDAPVPGSVQKALLDAGIVKDWNVGLNAREMEWVENRDWVYQTEIPDDWIRDGSQLRLCCSGLDYAGKILLNGQPVLDFKGSFTPYAVDLKPHLKPIWKSVADLVSAVASLARPVWLHLADDRMEAAL